MFRTKESKVAVIILLTLALLLITGVFPQYVLAGTVVAVLAFAGLWAYAVVRKKKIEPKDERSERCSLLATHNAFMAMILLTAFVVVALQAGWLTDAIVGLRSVWLLGMAAYMLSYLAYKRFAIG